MVDANKNHVNAPLWCAQPGVGTGTCLPSTCDIGAAPELDIPNLDNWPHPEHLKDLGKDVLTPEEGESLKPLPKQNPREDHNLLQVHHEIPQIWPAQ